MYPHRLTHRFRQLPRPVRRAIAGSVLLVFASLALAPGLLYRDSVAASVIAAPEPVVAPEQTVAVAAPKADLPVTFAAAQPEAATPVATPATAPAATRPAPVARATAPSHAAPAAAPTFGLVAASGFGHDRGRSFGGAPALASIDGGVSAAPQMRVPERTQEPAQEEDSSATEEKSSQPEQIADNGDGAADKDGGTADVGTIHPETGTPETGTPEMGDPESGDPESSDYAPAGSGQAGDGSTPADEGYTELAQLDDGHTDSTAPRPVVAVPEPSSLALVAAGIAALLIARRSQRS
jgi:hypothetical protein